MRKLEELRLVGWKSIRDMTPPLKLGGLNVLIGGNGAGKSNLVSFFEFLSEVVAGRAYEHIARSGGAESLLYFGPKRTKAIEATLTFGTELGGTQYYMRLVPGPGNDLVFAARQRQHTDFIPDEKTIKFDVDFGDEKHTQEAELFQSLHDEGPLARCRVFHFHDTSSTAGIRHASHIESNRSLLSDAGNLAAMLYLYKQTRPTVYRRIVGTVRLIAPFFDDFILEPRRLNPREILLNWRARGTDYEMGPHQFSDGTLRAIALCTLLLQPEEDLPVLIVLDEPELGLHPAALGMISGLMKQAAHHCQLLIATQSVTLLQHFDPETVIVVDFQDGASQFQRLDPNAYQEWLADYNVGDLWERNVIGGGPFR
jgi:predicted ATPase